MRLPLLASLAFACVAGVAHAQQDPVPVFAAIAEKHDFADRVEALGTLRANESVDLTASVTETITAVHFEDGQRVEAGQMLVEMTSAEEHAQLKEIRSTVNEAKKQLARVEKLAKQGNAPRALLDQRRREYETAKARLLATQSRLEDRLITASFDGVVGLRNISVGSLVEPGDVVTTLDDDNIMKLDFTIPTTFLDALHVGMPVVAKSNAFENEDFEGKVASIDSRVDPVTRSITVRALIPNEDHILRPGLLMTVELFKNPRQGLRIPESALIPEGDKQFVLVVVEREGESIAQKRRVKIGARTPGYVEIKEGLTEGDLVITHGTMTARDGGAVKVKARDDGGTPLKTMLEEAKESDDAVEVDAE